MPTREIVRDDVISTPRHENPHLTPRERERERESNDIASTARLDVFTINLSRTSANDFIINHITAAAPSGPAAARVSNSGQSTL